MISMGKEVKFIKDPLYGMVPINSLQLELLNTPEVQRLAHVRQLDFSYLVFPGATHTRIQHALGVSHITGEIADYLNLGDYERMLLQASGLLHDIGHPPFSHCLEPLQKIEHEDRGYQMITGDLTIKAPGAGKIPEILEINGLNVKEVASLIVDKHPKKYLQHIISGDLDGDQMDYLPRDAYYTGAHFGAIDIGRLITTFVIVDDDLAIVEKSIESVENMFISRSHMYTRVYSHHSVRGISEMVIRASKEIIPKHPDWESYSDYEMMAALKNSGGFPERVYNMIIYRNLFKVAYRLREQDVNPKTTEAINNIVKDKKAFENEMVKKTGLSIEDFAVDTFFGVVKGKANRKPKMNILMSDGSVRNITEVSDLVKTLSERKTNFDVFMIHSSKENTTNIRKSTKELIEG